MTTQESSYTLCLAEMKAGGAKDFKEVLKQALSDIEAACCAVGHPGDHCISKAKEILASLKNTMSIVILSKIISMSFLKCIELKFFQMSLKDGICCLQTLQLEIL